jgi:hypothetical protein
MVNSALAGDFRKVLTVVLHCFLASALVSCAALGSTFGGGGQKKDTEALTASVEAFNNAIRWEEYRAASALLAPSKRDEFWDLTDKIQKYIRIMDFEIRDVNLGEDELSGKAVLRYRYYSPNNPTIKTKMVHQKFRFLEKEKAWQITRHDLDLLVPDK